ncbi:MAG: LysM peptidoglycan-binding domain-containing protein [Myxococcales bacterium]|nr:LysM peptidoglycan-binding domain-containing protein [Myxococcales bacterium]
MIFYTVQPGDYLVKIAAEHGTTWEAIWSHPANAELRQKRGSPDILYPGDVLAIEAAAPPPAEPPAPLLAPAAPAPGRSPRGSEAADPPWPYEEDDPADGAEPTWDCPEGICVCHDPAAAAERRPHTIVLHDGRGVRMPGARVRVYEHGRLLTLEPCKANGAGEVQVQICPATRTLRVVWAPADLPPEPWLPFRRRYYAHLGGGATQPTDRRLANLGFGESRSRQNNVRAYQRAYGEPQTGEARRVAGELQAQHDHGAVLPFSPTPTLGPGLSSPDLAPHFVAAMREYGTSKGGGPSDTGPGASPPAAHGAPGEPTPLAFAGPPANVLGSLTPGHGNVVVFVADASASTPHPVAPDVKVHLRRVVAGTPVKRDPSSPYLRLAAGFTVCVFENVPAGDWEVLVSATAPGQTGEASVTVTTGAWIWVGVTVGPRLRLSVFDFTPWFVGSMGQLDAGGLDKLAASRVDDYDQVHTIIPKFGTDPPDVEWDTPYYLPWGSPNPTDQEDYLRSLVDAIRARGGQVFVGYALVPDTDPTNPHYPRNKPQQQAFAAWLGSSPDTAGHADKIVDFFFSPPSGRGPIDIDGIVFDIELDGMQRHTEALQALILATAQKLAMMKADGVVAYYTGMFDVNGVARVTSMAPFTVRAGHAARQSARADDVLRHRWFRQCAHPPIGGRRADAGRSARQAADGHFERHGLHRHGNARPRTGQARGRPGAHERQGHRDDAARCRALGRSPECGRGGARAHGQSDARPATEGPQVRSGKETAHAAPSVGRALTVAIAPLPFVVALGCAAPVQPPAPAPAVSHGPLSATATASASTSAPSPVASAVNCPDATKAFEAKQTLGTFCMARAACQGFTGRIALPPEWQGEPHAWQAGVASGWALLDDGRVFELGPNGFALRYVVDWGTARLLGDRLWVEQDGEVILVELATGAMKRLGRSGLVALGDTDLYVADATRMVRLRRSDLAALGSVPWTPGQDVRLPMRVEAMHAGATLLVDAWPGRVLADFSTGKVLRQNLGAATVRSDGARLVACDLDAGGIVEVDTATGATTASFHSPGIRCPKDAPGTTTAAYAADPRYVFWGEQGPSVPPLGQPAVVVAVGNTVKGTVTRYTDRTVAWSGFDFAPATFDARHARICLGFAMPSVGWRVCDWELGPGGSAGRSPGRVPPATGLPVGATWVADATSPAGTRTGVLYERSLPGGARELAATWATGGKVDRTTVVVSGKLPWYRLLTGDANNYHVGMTPVRLVFFDERHAAILPDSEGQPRAAYIDVDTGSVQPLCENAAQAGRGDCLLAGDGVDVSPGFFGEAPAHPRWIAIWETGSLFDGTTGKTYSVEPSDAEREKATHIVPACPTDVP